MDNVKYEMETAKRNAQKFLEAVSKWEETEADVDLANVAMEVAIFSLSIKSLGNVLLAHVKEQMGELQE